MRKRKIESLFICAALIAVLAIIGAEVWRLGADIKKSQYSHPVTKYGAFLAAQHAVYVNDFNQAAEFSATLSDVDYPIVKNTARLAEFLSGRLPADAKSLQNDKNTASQLIYDTYLVTEDNWKEMYKRHKKDESALMAPLRIWSSVANGKKNDALKLIEKLPTNASWQAFARGQIHAETGDIDAAADAFAGVGADFLNINDYLYLMSFYMANNMFEDADILRADFTSQPGGMFMLDFDAIPQWSEYAGYKNALAFSLIQNVSHTQIMMYSDLSILMLRMAQIIGADNGVAGDAANYYIGQFFFNNGGDFQQYFDKISPTSPYYMFSIMRTAEQNQDIRTLRRAFDENPLFVPAANMLVAHYVQNGNKRGALHVVDRALGDKNLTEEGRAFFTKRRAQINYVFGDFNDAQADLYAAAQILPADGEILSLQAKIWAAQNREIENAYDYAMTLVKQNPTDVYAWDTLGAVVAIREGNAAALDILTRVGDVSNSCSSLFMRLGDLYAANGDSKRARDAYMRAIDLSDDGLTIVPELKKKIRKLK